MGLILNNKIKKLQKGYPTRTAKEQVEGGVLGGTENLLPGNVVCFGAQPGEFTATFNATKIAGFALATNVKLVTTYPGESKDAPFCPGEAINLMISGYIAVELAAGTTVNEGDAVTTANGKTFSVGTLEGFNAFFTGVTEKVGSVTLAEIKYNM